MDPMREDSPRKSFLIVAVSSKFRVNGVRFLMIRVRLFIFCFLIAGGAASAEDAFEFWPGAQYDPSVPTFLEVLGHQPGQEIVSHVEILLYLRALEAADPTGCRSTNMREAGKAGSLFTR